MDVMEQVAQTGTDEQKNALVQAARTVLREKRKRDTLEQLAVDEFEKDQTPDTARRLIDEIIETNANYADKVKAAYVGFQKEITGLDPEETERRFAMAIMQSGITGFTMTPDGVRPLGQDGEPMEADALGTDLLAAMRDMIASHPGALPDEIAEAIQTLIDERLGDEIAPLAEADLTGAFDDLPVMEKPSDAHEAFERYLDDTGRR
jgi:hypothetical protein